MVCGGKLFRGHFIGTVVDCICAEYRHIYVELFASYGQAVVLIIWNFVAVGLRSCSRFALIIGLLSLLFVKLYILLHACIRDNG